MKHLKFFCTVSLILLDIFFGKAQNNQSAIYEAIALMNAKEGINVIMMPDAAGFYTIDPINGQKSAFGQVTDLTGNAINVANSKTIILEILRRNATGLPPGATQDEVLAAYSGNPFLSNILNDNPVAFTVTSSDLRLQVDAFSSSSDAGGGLTTILTNVANGTADFLIKRANEELTVSVVQKLKEFTEHYPEFNILFPRTISLIKPVRAYDYAKTLNALKSALQEDLDLIPEKLPELYTIPRYQEINRMVPLITAVFAASDVVSSVNNGSSVSESLHNLGTGAFLQAENNYVSFFKVVALMSDNLLKRSLSEDNNGKYPYISVGDIESVTHGSIEKKAIMTRYFLGLLYQHGASIPIWTASGQSTVSDLLSSWSSSSNTQLESILDRLLNAGDQLDDLMVQLKKVAGDETAVTQITGKAFFSKERFRLYAQIIPTAYNFSEPFLMGTDSTNSLKQELRMISGYWPEFSTNTINMIESLSNKEYGLAIDDMNQMLRLISNYLEDRKEDKASKDSAVAVLTGTITVDLVSLRSQLTEAERKINTISILRPGTVQQQTTVYDQLQRAKTTRDDLRRQISELEWQQDNTSKFLFTFSKVIDYYQLFAALSQAESGSEVEALLDAYALPSGSSRIKKEMDFNVAFNAYVGAFFARNEAEGKGFSNQYGFTAPIGFTLSHGLEKAGSLSVLLGIFDIGGIIGYKLDNEGQYQQDVNLVGLISPSLQAVYGFPFYLPLSLGAGWQWTTPATSDNNDINLKPHFNIFLAVDIPLFNLAASRKRER